MISDRFVMETPGAIDKGNASIPGRDQSAGRESIVSTSLNCENFGDWADAPISFSYRHDRIDAPFPEEKEDAANNHNYNQNLNDSKNMSGNLTGLSMLELKSNVPKLPVSKREIRKGNLEQNQPTIIFDRSLQGEEHFQISPIAMGSPVTDQLREQVKLQAEPNRSIKRSKSDIGRVPEQIETLPLTGGDPPSPSRRTAFSASKHNELSLSFSHRRKPFANRPLLMQIASRRKSYRQLDIDDDGHAPPQRGPMKRSSSYRLLTMDDDDAGDNNAPPSPSLHRPQPELAAHSTPRPPPPPITSYSDDDDDDHHADFEGTIPLKAASSSVTVKKRSTSKDRLNNSNKSSSEHLDSDEEGNHRQSRSGRRLKNRKNNLNDSYRSNGSSMSGMRRLKSEDEFDFDFEPDSPTRTPQSQDQERKSLLADVRRMRTARRLSNNGGARPRSRSRKRLEDKSNERTPQSKKKSARDSQLAATTPEEINKHTSRCRNRKTSARRASMTGGIVETEDNFPREKRRSSMGHLKASTPQRPQRRSTMDHFTPASPSTPTSTSYSPEYVKPRSRLSTHMSEEKSPSSNRIPIPFGEEGTVTTKDTQDTPELSNSFRRGPIVRKSSMDKARESRHNKARKNAPSRSPKVKQRKRSSSKNAKKAFEQTVDKTVTVAEILAVVASSKPSSKSRRSRSNDPLEVSDRSGSVTASSQSYKSRGKPSDSPKVKNRKSHRNRSQKNALESSFHKMRKKRVDQQPEEEREKRIVIGKETRHRGRRLSMR